jgi:hypothetical protein
MIIKVTTEHPAWPLVRQTPGSSGRWGDFQFVINREVERCDYWLVCDGLLGPETTVCPGGNVVLMTWEPPGLRHYAADFVAQFDAVITCHPDIRHPNVIHSHQGHPWFVGKSYDELKAPPRIDKTKTLSIVTSDKQFTAGHRRRYEFAMALKRRLGNRIDVFGRGIQNFDDKWDVLAPYQFSIAIENETCPDWLTEKLPDCFLAETFPFYYGCTNAEQYFDSKAFCRIDITDLEGSVEKIEKVISEPSFYSQNRANILAAKERYLDVESFFPHVTSLLSRLGPPSEAERICLIPQPAPKNRFLSKVRSKVLKAVKHSLTR